jgi:transposase
MGETITLDKHGQKRLLVLNGVISGQVMAGEAAQVLGLSERQIWRILAAYREEGAAALVHGNRGRSPVNALSTGVRAQVVDLAEREYPGYNHQHLTEQLNEAEGIGIGRSSVRRILLEAGMASPRKRRAPKHRSRRERYPQEGMLLQIDGSRHGWLESRGPYLTLVGAIDDATGTVPFALFREQEDTCGYFHLTRGVVLTKGCPAAIYRDRHSIFESSIKEPMTLEEQLRGGRAPTQFGRLLEELGIVSIAARSPQAKGRIERLWGTFQDRLVAELRRAGARTLEEANRVLWDFLPRFNRRFGVPPAQEGSCYRPLPEGCDPDSLFCFKYLRTVAADNTVSLGKHRLQLLPSRERGSYARAEVEVQERLDGSLVVCYQGRKLASQPAPAEAPLLRARQCRRSRGNGMIQEGVVRKEEPAPAEGEGRSEPQPQSQQPPASNHPWRRPLKRPSQSPTGDEGHKIQHPTAGLLSAMERV